MEINDLNVSAAVDRAPKCADGTPITQRSTHPGRPLNSSNIHAKQASSIAKRLKLAGIDWIVSFGKAIQRNDKQLLSLWLRLLPYLIVTQNHKRVKRLKGKASKAAMQALADLEGR